MSMVRQIEWWVQNEPITNNGVLPVTSLFFRKFCFSLKTFYKEVIWCTNYPNAHICSFCKHCSFICRCFFQVSILKHISTDQVFIILYFPHEICCQDVHKIWCDLTPKDSLTLAVFSKTLSKIFWPKRYLISKQNLFITNKYILKEHYDRYIINFFRFSFKSFSK